MRRKAPRLWRFLVCAALLSAACAAVPEEVRREPHAGIASLWRGFLGMPPERALAIAGNPDGRWVGAASGGHVSQLEAEQSALAECRERRATRRMQVPCRLYATGEAIVWGRR